MSAMRASSRPRRAASVCGSSSAVPTLTCSRDSPLIVGGTSNAKNATRSARPPTHTIAVDRPLPVPRARSRRAGGSSSVVSDSRGPRR
ncbi:hypothetical protein [Nonomuraea roseola]|uniref:Uncharacterized protein n=1 Tax=Nonomuraea roseola TaxID=46179 RepID=A0ABV5QCJ8_9ACTN